ncbi:MAG TPA: UbiA family prenyltransferase [Methanomicrobiales archaeon]|jgi:4-hydroxybenzoate polyprenyltransferase|nr:UbiA family prenyltransferase [Methanomicrobiales archaeon]
MESEIRNLYDLLVFSSVYLALECVAMTYISCSIQEIPLSAPAVMIPLFITIGIYNLNRNTDEEEDAINREARYRFTKRYEKYLLGGSLAAIASALGVSALLNLPSLLITLTPFLFGLLYSIPWLPPVSPYRRLKEIPLAKNLVVCISWALPAAMLPVCLSGGAPSMRTLILFLLFFSWGFLASASPDIRDRIGDERSNVRTIPVIYGEERTRKIMTGVNLAFGGAILILSCAFLTPLLTLLLGMTIVYAQACIHLLERHDVKDIVCDILIDGQYIFFAGAFMVLVTFHVHL